MPGPPTRPIQRTSPNDLMALAAESAAAPMQVAAVLVLDRCLGLADVRRALADRIAAVPRLRQRLHRAPVGCGRPVWVDDADFTLDRHVLSRPCPAGEGEAALLEVAAAVVADPLPRDRPLWSITVVSGMPGGLSGLVLVIHHVVADGMGGLAALSLLVDGAPAGLVVPFPTPPPTPWELFVDATGSRWRALLSWPAGLRLLRDAVAELRGGHVGHPTRCSLNLPTGSRRRLAVARTDLADLSVGAHAHSATINDVLLTAVSGALATLLRERGESADEFVLSVSVSGRRDLDAPQLGNRVGAMLVGVSARGDTLHRLSEIAETTRSRRRSRGRGASAALLGPAFRVLAQWGAFRWFVDRQRLVTTFVTNLRGPTSPMTFLGATVTTVIPVTLTTGNVTVSFAALSYAGSLVVTVIADSQRCPDASVVVAALQGQLHDLTSAGRTAVRTPTR
ncbi:MAG: wax ester/triacylglycerol synthase domain-containing protein [Nakamurella sp.]